MSIKLDWEIEAERERVPHRGEDPEARRARWRLRRRGLLLMIGVLLLIGAAVGVAALRLRDVDAEIDLALRATVAAEVTAIRIGDRTAFLGIQRSATNEWLRLQLAEYDRYQALKTEDALNLTGRVLDTTIDGTRGRVRLEEIVEGTAYARVWFYWRYEDGWRHVPPDYTFWGLDNTLRSEDGTVQVHYYGVDAPVAEPLAEQVTRWRAAACAAALCPAESLRVEIVPDEVLPISWGTDGVLRMPSPYISGAYLPQPFDPNLQQTLADLIARRYVDAANAAVPVYSGDAYFLKETAVNWLIAGFLGREQNAHLLQSIAAQYDPSAVGAIIAQLQPTDDLRRVAAALNVDSVGDLQLDWRDYVAWRLRLEHEAWVARERAQFLAQYDAVTPEVFTLANGRFDTPPTDAPPVVQSVVQGEDDAGRPLLRALVSTADGTTATVDYALVEEVWKRVN